ncbi:hypothetical protein AB6A40_001183 [Gnathostoma spinigerum]|uniref:Suppressor of Ty 6 homolog n=1 Tax=Gnathostoma spinigerum TaxID=75299 RepID=A0ABD6E3K8_9BILA
MSEFIDNQAEESENSGESTPENSDSEDELTEPKAKRSRPSKKQKAKKKKRIESDDDDDEEDDEEDDNAKIQKEMEGFVVDEDDIEDEAEDDDKSDNDEKDDDLELDDEDLDLLNDNLDSQQRPAGGRIVIESDEEEDDRERIKNNLFDADDYGTGDERVHEDGHSDRSHGRYDRGRESGSESERSVDDFIVTDDGHRQHQRQRYHRNADVPEQAMDEARDIFGVEDFNFAEFYDEDLEPGEEDEEYPEDEEREEGEGPVGRTKRNRIKEKKSTLLDTIEPAELEEKMLSPRDRRIQLEDRPERFQLRRIPVTDADDSELDLESKWIYQYAFDNATLSQQEDSSLAVLASVDNLIDRQKVCHEAPEKIKEALKFIRNQLFEVPFIAFYRKEYVESCLVINDLWKVYQWDEKWCHLQQRKKKLLELMKKMWNYQIDVNGDSAMRIISEEEMNEVQGVQTVEGLMDVSSKFQLYYGPDVPKMSDWEKLNNLEADDAEKEVTEVRYRAATRTDKYMLCIQNGIQEMAARFGLKPSEFAENLEWKRHDVQQDEEDPFVAAEQYICPSFPTAESVLAGAVHVVAKQISREPKVREMLRSKYRARAKISVCPTKKGREEIDENHKLYSRRYIKNKPISKLRHDEYLWYMQAKNNGLLNVRLQCDTEDEVRLKRAFIDEFLDSQPYHRNEFSDVVQKWNKLREEAVRECVTQLLIPVFEREVHERLLQEARDYVIKQCTQNLYERIKTAALDLEIGYNDDADDDRSTPKIMSIVYPQERDEASFGVLVDREGQVIDHIRLVHLTKRSTSTKPHEADLKRQDLESLCKFLEKKRPVFIAICGENPEAKFIKDEIYRAIKESYDSYLRNVEVEIIDNEAAKVYMNSRQAMLEFPDYPPNLRQAVSLARLLLDPLIEYSHLCNIDNDILCLSYHPLQGEIAKEDLLFALSLEFINRVNEVGVDVNRCLEFPYTSGLLQFVCGLGPRKAAQLIKILKQNDNLLESRTKLVTLCRMGPKVFMNSAGFIKIDTNKVSERTDSYVEVLDGSRVHPETYEWARKMAVDALEIDDAADPTSALEEILQNPDKLKDLDLDAFAEELARQGFGNKSITLYDIRAELNHRYKDLRVPYEPPSNERIFTMLTKETPDSIGKLVLGRVIRIVYRKPRGGDSEKRPPMRDEKTGQWKCQYCYKPDFNNINEVWQHIDSCPGQPVGVKVIFDSGITGFIPNKYLSDRPDSFIDPGERVHKNQPIYCRILDFDPDKFSANCSCRSSDLKGIRPQSSEADPYFDNERAELDEKNDRRIKEQRKVVTSFVKRVISHPSFHNVTFTDAERMLQNFEQGEAIIRPSSKSASHLTVTWKVAEGIYQHIDVKEEGKQHLFSLGKSLLISGDEFEDLDEILARHIQPMAALAREVLGHKYFLEGLKAEDRKDIELHLSDEKKRNPSRIPYSLTPSLDYPGKFVISYLPRIKVRHEYMTATPDGFRFRQQMFNNLEQLLAWFKQHYREPPPGAMIRQ